MRTWFILATLLLANVCVARDVNGEFSILSMGAKSCGKVVSDYNENGYSKLADSVWVSGYLTAYNEYMIGRKNIATGTDPAAWDLWIYNYCTSNPLENLAGAASALITELLKRRL